MITEKNSPDLAHFDVFLAQTCNRSKNAAYLHAINPEALVLLYLNVTDVYDDAFSCGADNPTRPYQQIVVDNDFFLRRTDGSRFPNWRREDGTWSYFPDLSPNLQVQGKPYLTWAAESLFIPFLRVENEFDGVFWDVQPWTIAIDSQTEWWRRWAPISPEEGGNQIDLDRDGNADPVSEVNDGYQSGISLLHQAMRQQFPEKVFINNGNNVAHPSLDGFLQEDFLNWSWAPIMIEYFYSFDPVFGSSEPNVVINHSSQVSSPSTAQGSRQGRYIIASTLMHDGYVAISDVGYNAVNSWYDEYGVDAQGNASQDPSGKGYLGRPLGQAYAADDPGVSLANVLHSIAQGGSKISAADDRLWRRDFEYGTVLINPSTTSKAATGLGNDSFRRIRGHLDPGVNNGEPVGDSLSIPPQDGLVLLRVNARIPTFADVGFDHPFHDDIEALYKAGYTAGCNTNPLRYCPDQTMNRGESAVFVERGIHSATYEPSVPTTQVFADLALDSWAVRWVNGLWQDQYTAGCGTNPLMYCPWQGHTRAEGAVFYLRMLRGATYVPPEPTTQMFADVSLGTWYAKWVQAAYDAGLIPPCQTSPELRFCPTDPLSRGMAAYMMVKAKGLR